jgi:flagellar basal body-associated protein FliL
MTEYQETLVILAALIVISSGLVGAIIWSHMNKPDETESEEHEITTESNWEYKDED